MKKFWYKLMLVMNAIVVLTFLTCSVLFYFSSLSLEQALTRKIQRDGLRVVSQESDNRDKQAEFVKFVVREMSSLFGDLRTILEISGTFLITSLLANSLLLVKKLKS